MNIPRPNIAKANRTARLITAIFGAACIAIVMALAGLIGFVISHFVIKYW